jgi:hypothetical protein
MEGNSDLNVIMAEVGERRWEREFGDKCGEMALVRCI